MLVLVQVQATHCDSSFKRDLYSSCQMPQWMSQFLPDKEFDILHSLQQSPTCWWSHCFSRMYSPMCQSFDLLFSHFHEQKYIYLETNGGNKRCSKGHEMKQNCNRKSNTKSKFVIPYRKWSLFLFRTIIRINNWNC